MTILDEIKNSPESFRREQASMENRPTQGVRPIAHECLQKDSICGVPPEEGGKASKLDAEGSDAAQSAAEPRPRRATWDEYFMKLCEDVAERSTCLRRRVGCVFERDHRILATGYNGAPSHAPHCLDVGCLREKLHVPSGERHELCRAEHAEGNAIDYAARYGIALDGSTCHVLCQPCSMCFKRLAGAGVVRIVWRSGYSDELTFSLARECGWEVLEREMRLVRKD